MVSLPEGTRNHNNFNWLELFEYVQKVLLFGFELIEKGSVTCMFSVVDVVNSIVEKLPPGSFFSYHSNDHCLLITAAKLHQKYLKSHENRPNEH